jgi:hypothetical protein
MKYLVAIVISNINMSHVEALWWLRIDYEVVLFDWNDYSMVSQAGVERLFHGSCKENGCLCCANCFALLFLPIAYFDLY